MSKRLSFAVRPEGAFYQWWSCAWGKYRVAAETGSKLYVEGALETRKWTDQGNVGRYTTEVVVKSPIAATSPCSTAPTKTATLLRPTTATTIARPKPASTSRHRSPDPPIFPTMKSGLRNDCDQDYTPRHKMEKKPWSRFVERHCFKETTDELP